MIIHRKVALAYKHIEQRKKMGNTHEEATNLTSIELASAAHSHCIAFLLQSGFEMIEKSVKELSPELGNVLRHLIELYAVDLCFKNLGDLLRVSH